MASLSRSGLGEEQSSVEDGVFLLASSGGCFLCFRSSWALGSVPEARASR